MMFFTFKCFRATFFLNTGPFPDFFAKSFSGYSLWDIRKRSFSIQFYTFFFKFITITQKIPSFLVVQERGYISKPSLFCYSAIPAYSYPASSIAALITASSTSLEVVRVTQLSACEGAALSIPSIASSAFLT